MVENEALSSDLNLIKELEELKIKQKLLIGSLNKKSTDEVELYLIDLNKKIDFLVTIFKDANSKEENDENPKLENFDNLNSKLDEIKENFNEKFEELEKSIISIKTNLIGAIKENNTPKNPPTPTFKVNDKSNNNVEIKKEDKTKKKWF